MDQSSYSLPKILIITGVVLIILGVLWWAVGDRLSWLGRLPGDIRIERENFRFYFPITTMILASMLLNLLFRVLRWMWNI
ncbi:MAG: DUF2905 domain-containing protein [Lewinellaceae bacterium]|nr:DUF2905 domain-containing protein [Lewinellaceae bacterium]